jgi:hypothetical protein
MALNCEEKLTADILKDCDNKASGGIEVNVVLINFDDIDKATSVTDANGVITNLSTKSGTSGFFVEGVKQVQGASAELVKKEDGFDKYTHLFSGVVLSPSAENKKSLSEIASGSSYVAVIEKKWKGDAQEDAFEVLGWDVGLVISTVVWNTKESDGVIKFELASEEGFEEPELPRNNLETNYATTKLAFDNKYATA